MKIFSKLIFLLILILLIMSISYHIPTKIKKSFSVCTLDGQQATVSIDVSWHKFFFISTELRGTITLNGVKYFSISDANLSYDNNDLIDRIRNKINCKRKIPYFSTSKKKSTILDNFFMLN